MSCSDSRSSSVAPRRLRPEPDRIARLPEQYFTALLARVAAAAAADGEPLVDLGRGNPEIGPPQHVVDALAASAARPDVHGYAPFAGLPALKEAIAARYRALYGVELDPAREVAVLPGTKTGLMEFAPPAARNAAPGEIQWVEPAKPPRTFEGPSKVQPAAQASILSPPPAKVPPPKPEPPPRPLADVLQSFLEESNVRVGEIIAGLLIVLSAVGLIISLREP